MPRPRSLTNLTSALPDEQQVITPRTPHSRTARAEGGCAKLQTIESIDDQEFDDISNSTNNQRPCLHPHPLTDSHREVNMQETTNALFPNLQHSSLRCRVLCSFLVFSSLPSSSFSSSFLLRGLRRSIDISEPRYHRHP